MKLSNTSCQILSQVPKKTFRPSEPSWFGKNIRTKSIFNLHDPDGVKFIYQLRVGLARLIEHKNRQNFLYTPQVN